MKKKNNTNKDLDGIYKFMALSYHSNWQYRWIGTPHMSKFLKSGKNESIAGHELSCIGFYFQLSHVCPALSSLVSKSEIYEILWSHDLGETFCGDVSQSRQVNGEGNDKHLLERKEIEKMSKDAPLVIQKQILKYFDGFESDFSKIKKIEILVTKLVDVLQANHFAMTFGNDIKKNKILIQKIVGRSFIPVVNQLLKILKQKRKKKAYEEVRGLALHHLNMMNKKGCGIDLAFLE